MRGAVALCNNSQDLKPTKGLLVLWVEANFSHFFSLPRATFFAREPPLFLWTRKC